MASHRAECSIVVVVLLVVAMVVCAATTTAAPNYCRNITDLSSAIRNSDICVRAKIKRMNDSEQFSLLEVHKVFCQNLPMCRHVGSEISVTHKGCVVPDDHLHQMDSGSDYLFFGHYNGEHQTVNLTANPLLFDAEVENNILDTYASIVTLKKPDVWVEENFRQDVSVDPVVYYVMEGTTVTMGCSYPDLVELDGLVVNWNTSSTQMPSTHSIIAYQRGGKGYQIRNFAPSDSRIYTCHSAFRSKLSKPSQLKLTVVTVKPRAWVKNAWQKDESVDPVVYYVTEGTTVTMGCSYLDYNTMGGWRPTRNISSTRTINTHSITFNEFGGEEYQIKNSTLKDSGIRTCHSRFRSNFSESYQLNLTVVKAKDTYLTTSILKPNLTEPVVENRPAKWEIRFIAHPDPVFKWKKQGKVLVGPTDYSCNSKEDRTQHECHALEKCDTGRGHSSVCEMRFWTYEGKLSLILHNPRPTDNGMYTLEASLPDTNNITTTIMFMMMPGKPQRVELESDSDKKIFKEGDSFSLKCTAEGYPKPNLTLNFNADPAEVSGRNQLEETEGTDEDDETSVAVQTVQWKGVAEEPGQYQCNAKNYLGTDSSTTRRILVTDGDSRRAVSLKLKIGGGASSVGGEVVSVMGGDNLLFTCRANRELVTKSIIWIMNGERLDANMMDKWGIEADEQVTRLSRVATIKMPDFHTAGNNITVRCMDEDGSHTSLDLYLREMTKPEWREGPPLEKYQGYLNETFTLNCSADGTPPLKVHWRKEGCIIVMGGRVKERDFRLHFEPLLPEDCGMYTCEISNRAGRLSASFTVDVLDRRGHSLLNQNDQGRSKRIASISTGILIAAVVVLAFFSCRTVYQTRKNRLGLQLMDQRRFMEGDPTRLNPELPLEQQADLLPYNIKFEVPRESIILGKLLGAGNFGRVFKATALNLLPGEERTTVAIKMIRSRIDCMEFKAMRTEIKIMIHIGQHVNIVNLLGACSVDLASKGELLLLLEYCRHGNILDYMHRCRYEFISQINDDDQFDLEPSGLQPPTLPSDSSSSPTDRPSDGTAATSSTLAPHCTTAGDKGSLSPPSVATDERHHRGTSPGTSGGRPNEKSVNVLFDAFCSRDVLEWAYQISKGMEYLASKKVVHTDLAARNVLLAPNNIVKISDFGLSKHIYQKNIYKNKSRGLMPIKWMAIECLRDGVYSTQGDVWSFGVVLWEIFSLGQMPYACIETDEHFIRKLENGFRLEHPRYSTKALYQIMLDCWSRQPTERPSFSALAARFKDILGDSLVQKYQQLTAPYEHDTLNEFLDKFPSQDYTSKMGTSKTTPKGQSNTPPKENIHPLQQTEDRPATVHLEDYVVLDLQDLTAKYIKDRRNTS